jgi:hypothetical protein
MNRPRFGNGAAAVAGAAPCSAFLDETPITQEWLLACGFKPVESDMGKNYRDHMEKGRLNIWEFNDTGDWLFNNYDSLAMRTRGRLRMLAYLLGEEMPNAEVSDPRRA